MIDNSNSILGLQDDSPMISICCTVYNHEKYLRQCLDGFVMQQGVSFEVLIHDDASTDHSADIIREYEKKYPGIIKPIYQPENQYSKGIKINATYQCPRVKGKYIAMCEGDDYWMDPYKLKKQYDALEAHPECFACFHGVAVETDMVLNGSIIPDDFAQEGVLSQESFFKFINQTKMFQTSSSFFRTDKYIEYAFSPPKYSINVGVGDLPVELYFGSIGNIYYLSDVMSCYRCGTQNSWTNRVWRNPKMKANHCKKLVKMFQEFEQETDGVFDVSNVIKRYYVGANLIPGKYNLAWKTIRQNRNLFIDYSFKTKLYIFLYAYFPKLMSLYEGQVHGKQKKSF